MKHLLPETSDKVFFFFVLHDFEFFFNLTNLGCLFPRLSREWASFLRGSLLTFFHLKLRGENSFIEVMKWTNTHVKMSVFVFNRIKKTDCRICLNTRRPMDKTQTALDTQTHWHTRHVCLCAAAGAPGCSDLDRWRGAVSGLRSMHHSLVTADLQQSFCFNYSQRSRQCGGRDLCSDISTTFTPPRRRASKWARGQK